MNIWLDIFMANIPNYIWIVWLIYNWFFRKEKETYFIRTKENPK